MSRHPSTVVRARRARRALDLFAVGLTAPVWAPVLGVAVTVSRVAQGRPVFFVQERVGADGVTFRLVKLRTMIVDADDHLDERGVPTRTRITPLGRLLRRTSLDELPQLLNVVRGEMSLVGPRPILPTTLPSIPGGATHPRFRVPPGLTGAAQVAGRNSVRWSRRLELDTRWAEDASVVRYLGLLLATPSALLRPTVSADRNPHEVDDLGPGVGADS